METTWGVSTTFFSHALLARGETRRPLASVPAPWHPSVVDRLVSLPLFVERHPLELLVHDEEEACPYLPDERARMPLRLPLRPLQPAELDARLSAGDRRHGALFYKPSCARCSACEAIRLDVEEYTLSSTQRRTLRKNDALLEIELGPPRVDSERLALYDAHRFGRDLARERRDPIDAATYQRFLVDRYCDSFEIRYRLGGRLVALAVTDRGERALSAVYCYYDPAHARMSLGTYSILKQLELARRWKLDHLYLGLYVAGSPAMEYKSRFRPHERLVGGEWTRFE